MPLLYWEPQDAGLCAVHCLNSLLQGPYFGPVELMEIANALDEQEKKIMMEQGMDSNDFIRYVAEDSGNVAEDGNYSVQVIEKALETFHIACIPMSNSELHDPTSEEAFICNHAHHWFSIRKIEGTYYNFNSLLRRGPEPISDFYLAAWLGQLRQEGYSVFVVQGELPLVNIALAEGQSKDRILMWVDSPVASRKASASSGSGSSQLIDRGKGQRLGGDEPSAVQVDREDDDLEAAIALSLAKPAEPVVVDAPGGGGDAVVVGDEEDEDDDEDMKAAIALSIQAADPSS